MLRRASISFRNLASLETRLLLDRVENFISIELYWFSLLYSSLLLLPLFIDSEDAEGAEEKCRQLGFKGVVSARTARFLVTPVVFVIRNILLSILQGLAGVPPKAVTRQIAAIVLSFESLHTRIKALFGWASRTSLQDDRVHPAQRSRSKFPPSRRTYGRAALFKQRGCKLHLQQRSSSLHTRQRSLSYLHDQQQRHATFHTRKSPDSCSIPPKFLTFDWRLDAITHPCSNPIPSSSTFDSPLRIRQ